MIRYAVQRLLLTIPTLILVLMLSFWLKSLAPGDEVARILEINGVSEQLGKEVYLNSYKDVSSRYHLDKPLFYFSITPPYFPDTLHQIVPAGKQALMKSIARQTKDWGQVNTFNQQLKKGQNQKLENDRVLRLFGQELLKFDQDRSLESVIQRKNKLVRLCEEAKTCPPQIENIIYSIESLRRVQKVGFPKLSYNGIQCQFHHWMSGLLNTKQNFSLRDGAPVYGKIWRALKWSLSISIPSFILLSIFALVIAVLQVYQNDTILDKSISGLLYFLYAIPLFWLATMAVVFFTTKEYGIWTNIFPSIGLQPIFEEVTFIQELSRNLKQLILPILCTTISAISYLAIQLKSDLLYALKQPYSIMAKAKGLSAYQIINKHALPNALIPYVTILAGAIPSLFAGSVIIEVIFNIPGMGRLLFRSIQELDWPVVFSILLISAVITSIGYLIGDLILAKLYPKTIASFTSKSSDKS